MNQKNSILNAQLLNKIEEYAFENHNFSFKLKGFLEKVSIYRCSFPNSFNDAHSRRQLKKANLNSFYELLNVFYKKMDINPIDLKTQKEDREYSYLQIHYFTKLSGENTIIICQTSNPDIFRMAYKKEMIVNYVNFIIVSEYINIENTENEIHKQVLSDLEKLIYGICQKINIEIPKEIDVTKFENLLVKAIDLNCFIEFLTLTTRNGFDEDDYKSDAKKLKKLFEKRYDEYKYSEKFRKILGEYYLLEDEVVVYDSFYNSDWKFDPEDLIAIVENIIGKEFIFDYPEQTYSNELFPYVQKALAKLDLELMSINCHGDNYFFFIANKNEVDRILELSQMIEIKIDKL